MKIKIECVVLICVLICLSIISSVIILTSGYHSYSETVSKKSSPVLPTPEIITKRVHVTKVYSDGQIVILDIDRGDEKFMVVKTSGPNGLSIIKINK